MTDISSLPIEIQRQCISYLDAASLKELRLTSRAFRNGATEALFREVTVRVQEGSISNFSKLLANDEFRRCIRTIRLDTWDEDKELKDECYLNSPENWWERALTSWSNMPWPNLKRLVVDTGYACADRHCESINLATTTFLSAANIDSLTIKHLQDACDLVHPCIKQFPSTMHKLNLLITTWESPASPDYDHELYSRHAFFNIHLNIDWLRPLKTQLTHLTLSCNTYWGIYPRWEPAELHFPHLKSLAFGNWTIAFDWQLDFIISHGKTLEQLALINCPILHALRLSLRQSNNTWQLPLGGTGRGPPPTNDFFPGLRWHTVLSQFKTELPKLRHFTMARGPKGDHFWNRVDLSADEAFDESFNLPPRIDRSRYAIFDFCGVGESIELGSERDRRHYIGKPRTTDYFDNSYWLERDVDEETRKKVLFPDCEKEDEEALKDFLAALRVR